MKHIMLNNAKDYKLLRERAVVLWYLSHSIIKALLLNRREAAEQCTQNIIKNLCTKT